MTRNLLILFALATFFLTACGGGKDEDSGAPAASSTESMASAEPISAVEPPASPAPQPAASPIPLPAEIETAGGVKVTFIEAGTGRALQAGDVVQVHYTGWLESGEKFDSSHDWGRPIEFRVGRGEVIKGWDEGFAALRVGSKAKLTIPAALA